MRRLFLMMLVLLFALTACNGDTAGTNGNTDEPPANAIIIDIIYSPEFDEAMKIMIPAFNESYRNGKNPVTGQNLASGEQPIFVQGVSASSGTTMENIVRAISNPNSSSAVRPTIFSPSVSHWLALANFQSGRDLFDLSDSPATANAPVVMAIWESRLEAIQNTVGYEDIGWSELLAVLNSPNGWQDYGIPNGRRTVYYGHTDPFISSTALSTLIAEFYASARLDGFTDRRLSLEAVEDPEVVQGVRNIENLIRHYSSRTTEFRNYIAQGPDYLDFVALEENDLIAINRGLTAYQPPERLVALYPREGTFWHEHPFAVPNAPWVTAEQRAAARVFTDYVLMAEQQTLLMSYGFRPVNPDVALGFPFEEQYGVQPDASRITVLDVPEPRVIDAVQGSWEFVKKQADILILIDTSGSMEEDDKIEQAKEAALAFLEATEPTNRVGLAVFDDDFRLLVPIDILETNRSRLEREIERINADGRTVLYNAIVESIEIMSDLEEEGRIRAVVLLSDGEDTCSEGRCFSLDDAITSIESTENELNPVILVPVGYGDISTDLERVLEDLASASNTNWISGDPDNIQNLLQLISSFF
jgi:Ca-activated chloride channel family protein